MKRILIFFTLLMATEYCYAVRNLILKPIEVQYSFSAGNKLILKASKDGKRLEKLHILNKEIITEVPKEELEEIVSPVLDAVLISGGAIGDNSIEEPMNVTIGYGAYHCELSECPSKVTFSFENGVYIEKLTDE